MKGDLETYLQNVKQRAESATEGLVAEEHNGSWDITNGEYLPKARYFYAEAMKKEDALFFVSARTDVPRLVEMVELLFDMYPNHWSRSDVFDELNKIARGEK